MKWFFHLDSNVIRLKARYEDKESIGTARASVEPGGEFHSISYATLRDAKAGVIDVDESGNAKLIEELENHDED